MGIGVSSPAGGSSPSTKGSRTKPATSSARDRARRLERRGGQRGEVERVVVADVAAEQARQPARGRQAAREGAHDRRIARRGRGRGFSCRVMPSTLSAMPPLQDIGVLHARPATSRQRSRRISAGLRAGDRYQTLLGATGTGKTATMAWIIEQVQKPALVIAHNKTLAAQLCNEFREFFPENAVEYFVSYYDYYQPEAYVPQADLYIEKDSSRNDDIARLRLAATSALFTRRDVIVVASVSCIYGLGSPEEWRERMLVSRGRRRAEPRRGAAQADRLAVRAQRRACSAAAASASRATCSRCSRRTSRPRTASRSSATRSSRSRTSTRSRARCYAKLDNLAIWPATRVRHVEADDRARGRRDPRRARRAGAEVRGGGDACSRRTASASAPSTTSR